MRAAVRGICLAAALALPCIPATAADGVEAVKRLQPIDVGMNYIDPEVRPRLAAGEAPERRSKRARRSEERAAMNPLAAGLVAGLREYRERWGDLPDVEIPDGPMLRRGDEGDRVRLLRLRLGLKEKGEFDRKLARAVRKYRQAHGLGDGTDADAETIASLNRGPSHYESLILANLARARALPADPGRRYIVVDTASARLWTYEDGEVVDTMKVVVGKESEQTPMLAGLIRYAMVNPYWNIPPDLVRDRVAPGVLKEGKSYLTARRYEILSGWTEDAKVLSPDKVNWKAVARGKKELRVRQLPGPGNMMGEIKFMFPNRFGVYLHDTPDKSLFEDEKRRFSSGCVRLEDARRLASWLFREVPRGSSPDREERVDLREPVPVYITYLTAAPSPDGIVFHEDGYKRDAALLAQVERMGKKRRGGGGNLEAAARR